MPTDTALRQRVHRAAKEDSAGGVWPRPPRRDVVDWPAAVGTASRRLDTRRNAGGGGANRGRQRGRYKGQRPAQRGSNAVATTRATAIPSTRKTDAVSDMPGRRRRHGSSPGLMGHGAAKRDSTTSGRAQRQLLLLRLDTAVSPTQGSPRHRLCAVTAAAVTAEITELTPRGSTTQSIQGYSNGHVDSNAETVVHRAEYSPVALSRPRLPIALTV